MLDEFPVMVHARACSRLIGGAFAALALLAAGFAVDGLAQAPSGPDTTYSTTNDSTGIVTGVAPYRTITVDSRRGPFTYWLGEDLHITGPDSRPLRITQVAPGDKVTVYYYLRDGHQTIARIVVLERAAPAGK